MAVRTQQSAVRKAHPFVQAVPAVQRAHPLLAHPLLVYRLRSAANRPPPAVRQAAHPRVVPAVLPAAPVLLHRAVPAARPVRPIRNRQLHAVRVAVQDPAAVPVLLVAPIAVRRAAPAVRAVPAVRIIPVAYRLNCQKEP